MLPVVRINGAAIGTGLSGAVFHQVLSAWSELAGIDVRRQILDGAARRAV
jgi:hypothetical protein